MPIDVNEGNIGRSVCPGFRKSTYVIGKTIRNNAGNYHNVRIAQIMMSLIELIKCCYQHVFFFFFFFFFCFFFLSPAFSKKSGGTLFLAFVVRGPWCVARSAWFRIFSRYLVPLTPPTVFVRSFWNFTDALRMVWRYADGFFRILK